MVYVRVVTELKQHLNSIMSTLVRMDENPHIEFSTTKQYEIYVADIIKGIEMINLLVESNQYYMKARKVSRKF